MANMLNYNCIYPPSSDFYSCILITNSIRPIMSNSPNLGPNPPGFYPKPWGLLDFQDIAIFYWLDLRKFGLEEQCLILKHRNARLKDKMPEELERIEEWMSNSDNINVGGQKVDIWEWRRELRNKELKKLVKKMEEDLKWITGMWYYKNLATRKDGEVPKQGLSHRSKEPESPLGNLSRALPPAGRSLG